MKIPDGSFLHTFSPWFSSLKRNDLIDFPTLCLHEELFERLSSFWFARYALLSYFCKGFGELTNLNEEKVCNSMQ